jgi:hypothetical protein
MGIMGKWEINTARLGLFGALIHSETFLAIVGDYFIAVPATSVDWP